MAESENSTESESPAALIDASIERLDDWRGHTLGRVRALIKQADPDVVEEVKWRKPSNSMLGVPVWTHDGIICTGETYKDKVKLTFAKGAAVEDPTGLFNSSLEGNTRRALDIHEDDEIDETAFKALVRVAVALNKFTVKNKGSKGKRSAATADVSVAETPKLLSGGNPQIAKADGDAPVQAYISAMPGWKHDVGRRLDVLIVDVVPDVRKAVRWNTPFYGVEGQGWFLSFHCLTRYIKVAFFSGGLTGSCPAGLVQASQRALPPYPRTRRVRRSSTDGLGEANQPATRRSDLLRCAAGRRIRYHLDQSIPCQP